MRVHPSDLVLLDLIELTETRQRERLLLHVAGCARCQERLRHHFPPRRNRLIDRIARLLGWKRGPADYDSILARMECGFARRQSALERERSGAVNLLSALMAHPNQRRKLILHNNRRFQTWGLFELLLERSTAEATDRSDLSEEMADLALQLSECLAPPHSGQELIEDLKARAWGQIANARRIRLDFGGAEEAFTTAFSHLRRGTGDAFEKAVLYDLKASLLRAQRGFAEAARLLSRAINLFLQMGDRRRAGRSLVNLSTVHEQTGEPEEAIPVLHRALDLIDRDEDPRLYLCASHNLIANLADANRLMEAQGLYSRTRPLYRRFPETGVQSREYWVRGKIARGLGRMAEAEDFFLAAREGLLASDLLYDLALVSLELASLYAQQGKFSDLQRVIEQVLPIFACGRIRRETLAALALLTRAG